jgi:hypothetical protein
VLTPLGRFLRKKDYTRKKKSRESHHTTVEGQAEIAVNHHHHHHHHHTAEAKNPFPKKTLWGMLTVEGQKSGEMPFEP